MSSDQLALGPLNSVAQMHALAKGFGRLFPPPILQRRVILSDDEGPMFLPLADALLAQRAVVAMGAPLETIADLSSLPLFQPAALRVLLARGTDGPARSHVHLEVFGSISRGFARRTRLRGTDQLPSFCLRLRQIRGRDIRAVHIKL